MHYQDIIIMEHYPTRDLPRKLLKAYVGRGSDLQSETTLTKCRKNPRPGVICSPDIPQTRQVPEEPHSQDLELNLH